MTSQRDRKRAIRQYAKDNNVGYTAAKAHFDSEVGRLSEKDVYTDWCDFISGMSDSSKWQVSLLEDGEVSVSFDSDGNHSYLPDLTIGNIRQTEEEYGDYILTETTYLINDKPSSLTEDIALLLYVHPAVSEGIVNLRSNCTGVNVEVDARPKDDLRYAMDRFVVNISPGSDITEKEWTNGVREVMQEAVSILSNHR